jgi:hypothetical protein
MIGKRLARMWRRSLRMIDRALLAPIMSIGAFAIERRVVRAMKEKPARATGDGTDQAQAQG